jgi:glutamate formiminotransferase
VVAGPSLLDVHRDRWHHRAVFTLGGPAPAVERAARRLTEEAVEVLDLDGHRGAHPRGGVVDVVPFVPLDRHGGAVRDADLAPARSARDRFAAWAGSELGIPCFLYGPLAPGEQRTLPDVRRLAFAGLAPDTGPRRPHPTAGWMAVGARQVLVAYNVWLDGIDVARARDIARAIRGEGVRALGLEVGNFVQVSCNLIDPWKIGPDALYDAVGAHIAPGSGRIRQAELVGLLPEGVLHAIPRRRWPELDLDEESTIEQRLGSAGAASR